MKSDSAFAAILEAPGGALNFQWRGADGGASWISTETPNRYVAHFFHPTAVCDL